MSLSSIDSRLKRLENISFKIKYSKYENTPNLRYMIKDVGETNYKIPNNSKNDELYKDLSDDEINNIRFNNMGEIMEFLYSRADALKIPRKYIRQPELIEIVDNSYLEGVLYDANRV